MKTFLSLLACLVLNQSCTSSKTDQVSKIDSVTLQQTHADTISPAPLKPKEAVDTTTHTLTLKWQNVLVDEFGTMYQFIDNKGNPHTFLINIPGFDFYNNEYFKAKYAPGAQFPNITMQEQTSTTWYTVTVEDKYGEDEEGKGSWSKVITAIKPLNSQ